MFSFISPVAWSTAQLLTWPTITSDWKMKSSKAARGKKKSGKFRNCLTGQYSFINCHKAKLFILVNVLHMRYRFCFFYSYSLRMQIPAAGSGKPKAGAYPPALNHIKMTFSKTWWGNYLKSDCFLVQVTKSLDPCLLTFSVFKWKGSSRAALTTPKCTVH